MLKDVRAGKVSTPVLVACCCLLAVLITAGGVCISASKKLARETGHTYSNERLVVVVSIVKTLLTTLWVMSSGGDDAAKAIAPDKTEGKELTRRESLLYAVPSALYTVSDNIAFVSLGRLNPATFSLIWNCKTAFSALLMRFFLLRRPFSWSKWGGLTLLLLGPILVELGDPPETHASGEHHHAPAFYHSVALFGSCVSASANVLTEFMLKRRRHDSLKVQMLHMAVFGTTFALLTLWARRGGAAILVLLDPSTTFRGFNTFTYIAIIITSSSSFIALWVLKYIDNIADLFAHMGAVLLTCVVAFLFFGLRLTWSFVIGALVSIGSLYLYYYVGGKGAAVAAPAGYKAPMATGGDEEGAEKAPPPLPP